MVLLGRQPKTSTMSSPRRGISGLRTLVVVSAVATTAAACGHAGGTNQSLPYFTSRARSELLQVQKKAGFRVAIPTWLPPGWNVNDVIFSSAAPGLPTPSGSSHAPKTVMVDAVSPTAGGGAVQIIELKSHGGTSNTTVAHVDGLTLYEQRSADVVPSHFGNVLRNGLPGGVSVTVGGVNAPMARLVHITVDLKSLSAPG